MSGSCSARRWPRSAPRSPWPRTVSRPSTGLRRQSFDLVLLDLKMPHVDGMETLRRLRERGDDTPVVIVTAHGDVPHAVEAMKLGAIDFLSKPLAPTMLRKVAAEVLAASFRDRGRAGRAAACGTGRPDARAGRPRPLRRQAGAEPPRVRPGSRVARQGAGHRARLAGGAHAHWRALRGEGPGARRLPRLSVRPPGRPPLRARPREPAPVLRPPRARLPQQRDQPRRQSLT